MYIIEKNIDIQFMMKNKLQLTSKQFFRNLVIESVPYLMHSFSLNHLAFSNSQNQINNAFISKKCKIYQWCVGVMPNIWFAKHVFKLVLSDYS